MKKPNQRIGADIVKTDLVELHQSSSNKSATYALHFDTEDTNQFCDFTEKIRPTNNATPAHTAVSHEVHSKSPRATKNRGNDHKAIAILVTAIARRFSAP